VPGVITCNTLGPVQVLLDGTAAPRELQWRKHLALLVYLARSPKRARTREHLIGLLWGDKPEENARRSLSVALELLRRFAGKSGITTDHGQVRLAPDAARLDTERFEEAAGRQDWGAAAALVAGEFLEGFAVPGAPEFEHWLTAERSLWRERAVEALARHAAALLTRGDAAGAVDAAHRAVDLDRTSESAARMLMRGLAVAGDRGAALEAHAQLTARLEEVIGAAPATETQTLADRIRSARAWRAPSAPSRSPTVPLRRAPLIGREAPLTRLLEVWAACRQGPRSGIAVIAGDVGLGKTRLLEELVTRARLDGAFAVTVRSVEADRAVPWSGLLGLARGGLGEAPGLAAAPAGALAAVAGLAPEWAERFAAAVRGVAVAPLPHALSDVLRAIVEESPLVLACDDAHWLDRDTVLALSAASRDLARAPLLLVCTVAPEPPSPELDELRTRLGRDQPGVAVTLTPLSAAALRELGHWALPAYGDAELDRVTRRITTDSAGLPLLAVELLLAVALGLDLKSTGGAWPEPFRTLDQSFPGDLPDAIVAAIRVRFRRLTTNAQTVLAAASVLGDRVEADLLARKTTLPADTVWTCLDEVEREGWLVAEGRGLSFRARVIRQVVARDMLGAVQRQRLLEES